MQVARDYVGDGYGQFKENVKADLLNYTDHFVDIALERVKKKVIKPITLDPWMWHFVRRRLEWT